MKRFLSLLFICMCFFQGKAQLFTKERLINNENFDKAKLSYGYYLGFNNYGFNIDYKTDVEDIQVIKSTGFNVGLIGNVRINDYFDIRLEPGLVISNRTLSYSGTYFEGLIYEEKDLESINLRNMRDKNRKHSPLLKHRDALEIHTGKLNKKQMIEKMSKHIDQTINSKYVN